MVELKGSTSKGQIQSAELIGFRELDLTHRMGSSIRFRCLTQRVEHNGLKIEKENRMLKALMDEEENLYRALKECNLPMGLLPSNFVFLYTIMAHTNENEKGAIGSLSITAQMCFFFDRDSTFLLRVVTFI